MKPLIIVTVLCLAFLSTKVAHAKVNIDKLAHAIAVAETSNCTKGVGKSRNNCFSVRGKNGYKYFASKTESYAHFKSMWLRVYGDRFPTWKDARKYTANPNPKNWMRIVTHVYNK